MLHLVMISRLRKMVSFELGKEIEKYVFQFVLSPAWDKEQILSPHEESNLRPLNSALRCSITEPQRLYGERGPSRTSYMTRGLYTARISDVDSAIDIAGSKDAYGSPFIV